MHWIVWLFRLPIVVEVFRFVVSGLLDITELLHRSTCCLWTLRWVCPSGIFTFGSPRSRHSLCSALKLSRFGCAHSTLNAETSPCSTFFEAAQVSLAYNIKGKTVLWKRLARRLLSSFALSTSFIVYSLPLRSYWYSLLKMYFSCL